MWLTNRHNAKLCGFFIVLRGFVKNEWLCVSLISSFQLFWLPWKMTYGNMVNYGKEKKLQNNNINCTTIVRAEAAQNKKKSALRNATNVFTTELKTQKKSVQQHIVAVGMWLLVGNNRHKYVFHKCPSKIFPIFMAFSFSHSTPHIATHPMRISVHSSFCLNYLKRCLFQYKYANVHEYCEGMNWTCIFSVIYIWSYHFVQWAHNWALKICNFWEIPLKPPFKLHFGD